MYLRRFGSLSRDLLRERLGLCLLLRLLLSLDLDLERRFLCFDLCLWRLGDLLRLLLRPIFTDITSFDEKF